MDVFFVIFLTSVIWIIIMIVACVKAYGNGMIKGANMHSHYLKQQAQEKRDAMLSEMDGVDEGNGDIRRISHGEMAQMETAVKNQTQQNGEKEK
jgi:hypothetical protein